MDLLLTRWKELRERAGLSCPGSFDTLHREIKGTLATLHVIDGAKLDAAAILSPNFHVSHSLTWGGQQYPPSYNFLAAYQKDQVMLSGQMDHDLNVQGRAHYAWKMSSSEQQMQELQRQQMLEKHAQDPSLAAAVNTPNPDHHINNPPPSPQSPPSSAPKPSIKSKVEVSLPASDAHPAMISLEHEHVGEDYSITLKAINPNPIDAPASHIREKAEKTWGGSSSSLPTSTTGIYSLQYLQSITRHLTLGGEFVYQRPTPDMLESAYTLVARYIPTPVSPLPLPSTLPPGMPSPFPPTHPTDPTDIYTATYSPSSGMLHASYWKKLNARLDVATELQALITPASGVTGAYGRREGIASVGFRLITVFSCLRGMIDTMGRVTGTADYTLAPGLTFNISGELDFGKGAGGQGRVGLGFSLEA